MSDIPTHLSFRDDLHGHCLPLELSFLYCGRASMPKVPPPDLLPQFVLGAKILPKPEILVQRPLDLSSSILRYGSLLGFRRPEPLHDGGLDVLSWRRRRERSFEEPPWRGPGRRRRDPGGERAPGHSTSRVRAGPRGVGWLVLVVVRRSHRSACLAVTWRGAAAHRSTERLRRQPILIPFEHGDVLALALPHAWPLSLSLSSSLPPSTGVSQYLGI